jgi:N-acetylglucosaminyl-diphospho-decaprenol L-rhamnosyltransferase
VDWVVGFSMILNLSRFKNKKIFDNNFFLFFEETDLCMRIIKKGGNIFTCSGLRVHHLWGKGSLRHNDNNKEKTNLKLLREWHNMWSSFYFYKKHRGYIIALFKHINVFLKTLIKIVYFYLTLNEKKKERYKYKFLGLFNSILNKSSYLRM